MTNRFPGPCQRCGVWVEAGAGRVRFIGRVPQGAEHYYLDECAPRACCGTKRSEPCECADNWRAEEAARSGRS